MMRNRGSTAAIIFLAVVLGVGCNSWRGFGFRASGPEMPRLRHELALTPGMSVADVGAGSGELTVALAAEVGPGARVFSTEIDSEALKQIRAAIAAARLTNVTVIQAQARDANLPTDCCNAVILRRVYHHLTHPAETNASLLRALRPGGLLAIIDFSPTFSWLWPWPPKGVHRIVAATVSRHSSWLRKPPRAGSSSCGSSTTGPAEGHSRAIARSFANRWMGT